MKKVVYQCDNCQKEATSIDIPPDGWVELGVRFGKDATATDWKSIFQYCSRDCAKQKVPDILGKSSK